MIAVDSVLAQFLTQFAVGTIAGGVTNAVAVWLLFHPRKRVLGIQGAIPKNHARLAKSLGRTVGERLLTPSDVTSELSRAGFRDMLDRSLVTIVRRFLETERGPLREILPPAVVAEVEQALEQATPAVVARVWEFVESAEFEAKARALVARTRAELADRPVGTTLTPERRVAISSRAQAWAEEFAQSPALERNVREYIDRHAHSLLDSPEPLSDRVPAVVVSAIEGGIDAYLPLAAEKLGKFLQQPAARDRLREALHELFARFVDDLRFHERVIARLVVTERTLEKALDSIERDGVDQLAALLDDPVVRDEISRTVHDALTAYLRKPLRDIVGPADSERARALADAAGSYLLRIIQAEGTRQLLIEKLDQALERAEARTWGQVLAPVEDGTIAAWITAEARSPRTRALLADVIRGAMTRALDRPIGRPARFLPPDIAERIARAFVPAVWTAIETQLPELIQRLDVPAMVERKVLAFDPARLEELIKGVIERELKMIVFSGYVLGGFVATLGFLISRLFA